MSPIIKRFRSLLDGDLSWVQNLTAKEVAFVYDMVKAPDTNRHFCMTKRQVHWALSILDKVER